jgi:D-amino-acid oxidase
VSVVGAGVIGLSVAHELAAAGHTVRILADREAAASTSGMAAAIWFPHDVKRSAQVLDASAVTYQRFQRLAEDPDTGVAMRAGTVLSRRPDPDLSWTRAVPHYEPLDPALGVEIRTTEVRSLAEVQGSEKPDAIVVAAGLRSAALLGDDDEVYPIRGQVVRLANPGLTDWITDQDNPGGLTYVVPRRHDVVCGGTGEAGSWDDQPDPETEAAILRRVCALVPELAGQPVLSRGVGLRPARSSVRVEAVPGQALPVIACYGHGGAGFTLSWGDAARVTTLIGPPT